MRRDPWAALAQGQGQGPLDQFVGRRPLGPVVAAYASITFEPLAYELGFGGSRKYHEGYQKKQVTALHSGGIGLL